LSSSEALSSSRAPSSSGALEAFRLDGQVAIVTGASSGLGEAAARGLADAGATVAVVARRLERLEALAKDIGGYPVAADLLNDGEVAGIVPRVAAEVGPPVIVVNAAGHFLSRGDAQDEELSGIRATLDLNLVAPFRLAQGAFGHMKAAGRGSIVNISSISGQVGIPGIPQASYAASKAALSGLTVELAVQWARHGIRVNTIAPGFFRSEITGDLYDEERSATWLRRNTPLPIAGTPGDFTGAIVWLASDAGRYVTGQTIRVDGGWTAR
jgi:NAD(P)-dependent dehydrogenase (short-subunit alcohol dehydrogenase family)